MTTDIKYSPVASAQQDPSPKASSAAHINNLWTSFEKMGAPVNRFINKVGSEAFMPTGLEEESEKAARILKSFCHDGIIPEQPKKEETLQQPASEKHELSLNTNVNEKTPLVQQSNDAASPPLPPRVQKSLLKIPQEVIQNALGLAIFTVFRLGMWGPSLSAGSGVLVARDPETRKWSSPSALGVSTIGLGFMTGLDVVDCVIVINTPEALERFKGLRWSLGGDIGMTLGPWGAGAAADYGVGRNPNLSPKEIEAGVQKEKKDMLGKPVYVYSKSRGLYVGLTVDGTVMGVRNDENARFYGDRVDVSDIFAGRARRWTALNTALEEIDESPKIVKEETQIQEAPVILEFIDRRGQRRGSDGVWVDVQKEMEIESETNMVNDIRKAEEAELEKKLEKKKEEEKAWKSRDTFA